MLVVILFTLVLILGDNHHQPNGGVYNPNQTPTVVLTGPLANLGEASAQFPSANEQDLFGESARASRLLYYPSTILETLQDHLKITQYNYKAPYRDAIFPKDAKETLRCLPWKNSYRRSTKNNCQKGTSRKTSHTSYTRRNLRIPIRHLGVQRE